MNTKKATKSLQLFCRLTQNVNVSPWALNSSQKIRFNNWVALNKKGAIVTGKVTAVDAKGATVELADGVEGYLRASEASRDRVEDATLVLSVGDEVEAKFTGVIVKNRAISLSVRAKDEADEKDAIATVNKQERCKLLQQRNG
ncbi:30S ribosomal protein S1 [Escherichia coli]|uniref:30S ribosomal protein S1 n=1 Tax=Escherichia coli TaxID=562 RepID=A0A377AUA0_ECOLX|nr:30S ribosomal protein S1 [Escherichia coli]